MSTPENMTEENVTTENEATRTGRCGQRKPE